jgi:hypothetical protein
MIERHDATVTGRADRTSSGKGEEISRLTPERIAEKRAFREIVRGVGGFEAAALNCRVGKSTLARYTDETCDDHAPLDVIADLEPLTRSRPGWPHVTRHLAREQGFVLVSTPEQAGTLDVHTALATATKEHADLTSGLITALADGAVQPYEAKALLRDSWDQVEAAVRLHALLTELAERC